MKRGVFLLLLIALLPLISASVVINEVELNPPGNPDATEWVELYNTGPPVNLSGWYITDRDGIKFFSPNTTIISFLILEGFGNNKLVNTNENISLFNNTNGLQDITGPLSDSADDNSTWSRVPNGTGNFTFQNRTKNATNGVGPDTTKPSVFLQSPSNGSITTTNLTYFEASFIDNINVSNATLYIWNASNNLIGTNFTSLGNSSISTNLSFLLNYVGTFFWNYLAVDSSSNQAFNNSNFTLIFTLPIPPDTTSPIVNLLSPLNGSNVTTNITLFSAHFTDNINVSNATLYVWNASNDLIGTSFINLGNDSIVASILFTLNYQGTFFWNYLAVDNSGNQAFNNSNFTLIFFQNQTNISIDLEIKNKSIDKSCVLSSDNVTLRAEIIGSCTQNVIFSVLINGTWQNFTGMNPINNISTFTINNALLSGSELINWTVYATSCSNQTVQDGMEQFYVNSRTSLYVNPPSPDGIPPWYISEPEFTLTNPDATKIFYRWDSTGTLNYTSPFKLENAPNQGNITAGILQLTYWSDVCSEEPEKSFLIKTDFTNPVITNLQPPANSTVSNSLRPTIQALLDEVYQSNSGINKPSVKMFLDGNQVLINILDVGALDAIASHNPASDLSLGKHNATINVSDNAGRSSQLTWMFEINISTIFNFTVYSPQNLSYNTRRISFNMTATEKLDKIEYINYNERNPRFRTLCRECKELGFSRSREITLLEGANNLNLKFTDMFGRTKETNISLFIDSEPPKISQTDPKKNIVTNGSDFMVKYSEDKLKEIILSWNPNVTLANCTSGKNQICSTDINLSNFDNQFISYKFKLSDGINVAESKEVRVMVDTTSPELNIIAPINTAYDMKAQFNITISEKVLLEYFDSSDFSPRWKRLCSNCNEHGNLKPKFVRFKDGFHKVLVRATDEAGNSDLENVNFTIS